MGTIVWAWAKGWFSSFWAPLTIPILLIVLALTIYITNQYKNAKKEKGLTKLSPDELDKKLQEWTLIPSWKMRRIDSLNYEVTSSDVLIRITRPEPLVFELSSTFKLESEKTNLSESEWARLRGQTRIDLARLGIQFQDTGVNQWQLVEDVVIDDTLTGYRFRPRIMFVIRAWILVFELWNEALRQSEQSTSHKGDSQTQ